MPSCPTTVKATNHTVVPKHIRNPQNTIRYAEVFHSLCFFTGGLPYPLSNLFWTQDSGFQYKFDRYFSTFIPELIFRIITTKIRISLAIEKKRSSRGVILVILDMYKQHCLRFSDKWRFRTAPSFYFVLPINVHQSELE